MALDATAREANIRDSIKKYFVDSLTTAEGIPVTFDRSLASPDLQGKTVTKWVSVKLGDMEIATMSRIVLEVFVCTRQDNEGFKLAQLKDKVLGYLSDEDATDGYKRISFYQSHATNAWTLLGAILVTKVIESGELEADDDTKYKLLTCFCRTASKI
jgi:hypothetical protein